MTETNTAPYPILEIPPDWVLESEPMGSKDKFWCGTDERPDWLFKYPQPNTGQHCSEKIAAEVADGLDILHAQVELALFQGVRGSATASFAREGREVYYGNQVLAGHVLGYDPGKQFGQSDHTLESIFLALERVLLAPEAARRAKEQLADYLVLDALIGNTDRHHENWGILRKRTERGWQDMLAPTFDHASSLGRELVDDSAGKCRRRLLAEGRLAQYAEKAPGAIFWQVTDKHGISPLELVRRAAGLHTKLFAPALKRLENLDRARLHMIVRRVPEDWMSELARDFAVALMCYTLDQLRKIIL
ncbi:MAG: HipA domain-containing protein [Gammaproteobacteria bacterium]